MPGHPAIHLMGPTGAGKTELAARLVADLPLEIVSVDSAMVFRGMDIGTAKPGPELLARAPHHLIDLIDPAETFSAARFVADAGRVMAEIRARGRVPLLVGGTMLYFRALQSGLAKLPPADAALRAHIEERAGRLGWPALHAELERLDPRAVRVDRIAIDPVVKQLDPGREWNQRLVGPARPHHRLGELFPAPVVILVGAGEQEVMLDLGHRLDVATELLEDLAEPSRLVPIFGIGPGLRGEQLDVRERLGVLLALTQPLSL